MYSTIQITNLHKIYKNDSLEVHALNGIDLRIEKGEFISIMGSSGSGKSTLMNILGCLDEQTVGEYFLDGINIRETNSNEKAKIRSEKIGFVFQNFNLLSRNTAKENVELPLVYSNTTSQKRSELASKAISVVGLSDRENHLPTQLSGGQQQRVAIARAIVNNPSIILADEPTGNLDSKTSFEIMEFFCELNIKGKTIVMITHEENIAEITNRIVRLNDGKIISDRINKKLR